MRVIQGWGSSLLGEAEVGVGVERVSNPVGQNLKIEKWHSNVDYVGALFSQLMYNFDKRHF